MNAGVTDKSDVAIALPQPIENVRVHPNANATCGGWQFDFLDLSAHLIFEPWMLIQKHGALADAATVPTLMSKIPIFKRDEPALMATSNFLVHVEALLPRRATGIRPLSRRTSKSAKRSLQSPSHRPGRASDNSIGA
ncbi:hypothetical protein [Rhizobium mesoamericanum]|uniref:Uncharacterized protein n=1 Tax=Rhizobium mesoamericanum STM3625 TaxID=1211777 RepID=K0Q5Y8_9HYPH|nr:hypothetical protein [Rhizobium mesoamericanum]CCM78979.1 hypothetical protein BN77_p10217 [Rhizobium mesoamericanum STM3625]